MSLKSLIPKRTSLKSKKAQSASKGTCKTVTEVEQMSVLTEVNDVLAELLNNVPEKITETQEKNQSINSILSEDNSNSVDQENCNARSITNISSVNDEAETFVAQKEEIFNKQTRSVSAIESEIKFHSKNVRRKSEGEILSICEKIIPPEQQKELQETIGKYIDKVIRNSISEVVKNVNVERLYEDVIKDISNRKSSESTESEDDFVVEQRLSSDSISELVELSEENSSERNGECRDFSRLESDDKTSETESLENDDAGPVSFGGYLADVDDTTSVDDLKSIGEDSLNSSLSSGLELKATTINANEESSEEASKNESRVILKSDANTKGKVDECKQIVTEVHSSELENTCQSEENIAEEKGAIFENVSERENYPIEERTVEQSVDLKESFDALEENTSQSEENTSDEKVAIFEDVTGREESPTEVRAVEQNVDTKESFDASEKITSQSEENTSKEKVAIFEDVTGREESPTEVRAVEKNVDLKESFDSSDKNAEADEKPETNSPSENKPESEENLPSVKQNNDNEDQKTVSLENNTDDVALIVMSPEEESLLLKNDLKKDESIVTPLDTDELLQQNISEEEQTKINWKVGYLHVKLPHKTRGKGNLKAWKKRRVVIQPDEFVNDPKNPSLVISVYGSDSKKLEASFWHSLSSQKATVFRSSSRTHRYAFTISEDDQAIIHLSAENESASQEWMAAVRAVLWPPSPFMELEKMLSGQEFEISIIDNDFSYHAGLLGMYGYLSITPKKLILLHPQQGYVIQEWYLNTVDKFQFVHQSKSEDAHKVLCMSTCKDSSTGQGDIIFFCNEAVTLLQSLASNIHQVLSYHSKQEGGRYKKELEDIAEWLVAPPQDCLNVECDEHYKVPPRQVKSLLDIPNFIFNKSLSPVASAIYPAPNTEIIEPLDATKTTVSQDSGISTGASSDDFLNCSVTSFVIGGGPLTGKSSDSELSDAYTPPRTPEVKRKAKCEVVEEEQIPAAEA